MPNEPPPLLEGAPGARAVETPDWLVYMMWAAVAFAALWMISTIFIHLRRRATNLTSAQQASVKKDATPDFLKVDQKAREAAMQRGAAYEAELTAREKAEAEARKPTKKEPVGLLKTISGVAAFLFSLFTLLGSVLGTFRTLDQAGVQLSKFDQVGAIITQHPIPTVICIFVIGYTLFIWVSQKKWTEPPKI